MQENTVDEHRDADDAAGRHGKDQAAGAEQPSAQSPASWDPRSHALVRRDDADDLAASIPEFSLGLHDYLNLMNEYRAGIREIQTKFEILDTDMSLRYDRKPIHSISTRLKSPKSLIEKLRRRDLPISLHAIQTNIFDVAGVRVVCNYLADVYDVARHFLAQDDIHLITRKDYIEHPKESGYRSLHLVVSVPVFLADGPHQVPVEVQLRTIAMDFWATLEHRLRYKNGHMTAADDDPALADVRARLVACADGIAGIDEAMQDIREQLDAMHFDQPQDASISSHL